MYERNEVKLPEFISLVEDYMFALVMRDKGICADFLKMVLPDEEFLDIKLREQNHPLFSEESIDMEDFDPEKLAVEIQKSLKFDKNQHGVRFDALVKGKMQWAEIEMQAYKGSHLGKRSRAYQANMDLDQLETSDDYRKLKRTYVIFICTYDYFKLKQPVYFFRSYDENLGLPLNDEAYKIILNTACPPEKVPDHLKAFYAYINDPSKNEGSEFVKAVDKRVRKFNSPEWRHRAMTLEELMRQRERQGYDVGKAEGRAEGRAEGQAAGQAQMQGLYRKLKSLGRLDDYDRAMEDAEFRHQLLKEFGI